MDLAETIQIGHNPEDGYNLSQEPKESEPKQLSDKHQDQEDVQMLEGQEPTAEDDDRNIISNRKEKEVVGQVNQDEKEEPQKLISEDKLNDDQKQNEIKQQKEQEEEKRPEFNEKDEQLKSLGSHIKSERNNKAFQEQETAPLTQQEDIVSPEVRIQFEESNVPQHEDLLPEAKTSQPIEQLPPSQDVNEQKAEIQHSHAEPIVEDIDQQEREPRAVRTADNSQIGTANTSALGQRPAGQKTTSALQTKPKMHRKGVSQIPESHLKTPSKPVSSKQKSTGINSSMQESSSQNYRHKLNQLMDRKEAGDKIKKEFLLQKYKNQHFEERKEMSADRRSRIEKVYSSQVRISHEKDNSEYLKFGKKDIHSTKRTSFSNGRREVWWNQYQSSLNGSEACQNSYRQADTPLRAEIPLIPQTRLGVDKKVQQMRSSFQNSPYIAKGPEQMQGRRQMNTRAAQVYESKVFFGMGA